MRFIVLILVVLAQGCSKKNMRVISTVTPFYQSAPTQGKTFFIYPLDTKNMDSPEFFHYAGEIARNLEENGLVLAGKDRVADYVVMLGYGIDGGRDQVYTTPIIGRTSGGNFTFNSGRMSGGGYGSFGGNYTNPYGNTGSYTGNYTGNFYGNYSGFSFTAPTFGVVGTSTQSVRLYTRLLYLSIMEINQDEKRPLKTIYECRTRSVGTSSEIAMPLPRMIEATFKDFPGESGTSKSITLDM